MNQPASPAQRETTAAAPLDQPNLRPLSNAASPIERRRFLKTAMAGAVGVAGGNWNLQQLGAGVWSEASRASRMANDKLNVAIIGTANRAADNIAGVEHENITMLCDVDATYLGQAAERFPAAKTFADYRKLLEAADQFDAVVVSTPDHHHFHASYWAMEQGKHCYCEKPLTHTVWEARTLNQLAKEKNLVTQMGTQIHATRNYRNVVEVIRSGAIGAISHVHVWVGKGWGGGDRPEASDPVPAHLDWDLWLGGAPERPFKNERYHPAQWRRWWDFGGGTLGDMACHLMDLPFWALELAGPTQISAIGPDVHAETCPLGLQVAYQFAASEQHPALGLTWYDGDKIPKELEGIPCPGMGVMFVGAEGILLADYDQMRLFPEEKFKEYQAPEHSIPDSIGHHREWTEACKNGGTPTCNFGYSGPLTEAVLLGNIAYRSGQTISWDAQKLTTGDSTTDSFLRRAYRDAWQIG